MKTKVAVLPIWKIVVSEKLYYFVLGTTKKSAIENMKNNSEDLIYEGNTVIIESVNPEDAHKILLQLDLEDEEEYTTLFEEAKYYSEHNMEFDYFLASSFDVIADATINYIIN